MTDIAEVISRTTWRAAGPTLAKRPRHQCCELLGRRVVFRAPSKPVCAIDELAHVLTVTAMIMCRPYELVASWLVGEASRIT